MPTSLTIYHHGTPEHRAYLSARIHDLEPHVATLWRDGRWLEARRLKRVLARYRGELRRLYGG